MKKEKVLGLNRDLNPGPPAPEAGIIPLDHWATLVCFVQHFWMEIHLQIKLIRLNQMPSAPIRIDQSEIWKVVTTAVLSYKLKSFVLDALPSLHSIFLPSWIGRSSLRLGNLCFFSIKQSFKNFTINRWLWLRSLISLISVRRSGTGLGNVHFLEHVYSRICIF